MSDGKLAVLLACFDEHRGASKARRGLESRVNSNGDAVLDTVLYRVNGERHVSISDPGRAIRGACASAISWGLFGLLAGTDGLVSLIVWAAIGALCGGLYGYFADHLLTKGELAHIGEQLPASSSALVSFVETRDARRLLKGVERGPTVSSVVSIDDDLRTQVLGGGEGKPRLSMIMLRYGHPDGAKKMASELARQTSKFGGDPRVELVIGTDLSGHHHVAAPKQGVRATAKSDLISWGGFGLVFGAIVGAIQGAGILGFLQDGVVTGVAWAIFGLFAGALYGL